MVIEKVRVALVASCGGTDANSVMKAYKQDHLPANCEIVVLISTKEGAGCLEKAAALGIPSVVIPRKGRKLADFHEEITQYWRDQNIELVFSLGCVVILPLMPGVIIYNIHPAHPEYHGGRDMYGLAVHEHVLSTIVDKKRREWESEDHRWFTYPTVHEVTEQPDHGRPLVQLCVEIPPDIIELATQPGQLTEAAERLQKLVLPFEWLILPAAVSVACQKIAPIG